MGTWIVGGILLVIVAGIVWYLVRQRKKGGCSDCPGCTGCSGCSGCTGSCGAQSGEKKPK